MMPRTPPAAPRTRRVQSKNTAAASLGGAAKRGKQSNNQTAGEVLARIEALANPKNLAGMAHFGIKAEGRFGLSVPQMRGIAKTLGHDHALALELWATGHAEARIIACMVEDPARVTSRQADVWARGIDSWDVCDGFAYDLMSRTPMRWAKPAVWARSQHEFVRRAAFALIAGLAAHDKDASDAAFVALLPLIKRASTDDRNFVKKAVNWALRGVGKRNPALNRAAIAAAKEIRAFDSRSARWIAADALRELTGDAVQQRLHMKAGKR
jgi:3-methyladenine DNA glycosylase AlkD